MKIIFDSEKQKNKFFALVGDLLVAGCPTDIGLTNTAEVDGECGIGITTCKACWEKALGVAVEVANENTI